MLVVMNIYLTVYTHWYSHLTLGYTNDRLCFLHDGLVIDRLTCLEYYYDLTTGGLNFHENFHLVMNLSIHDIMRDETELVSPI